MKPDARTSLTGASPPDAGDTHMRPRTSVRPRLLALGASTGGPRAVAAVLGDLRHPIPIPVLLVIHVSHPLGGTLARWLDSVVPAAVTEARHGEPLPGPREKRVILAPPGSNLVVRDERLWLTEDPDPQGYTPSVDMLFHSVAGAFGPRAIGCVLTGMGRDGASGLLAMRAAGALTLAQDEASSTVFGMPREAIRIGAARRILALSDIAPTVSAISGR
ncbi:CheB methylesterase domain-containing protein [Chondromyces apiculatus]|uniref:protein-glutamate methylesterase n=1 Tax=Chondromyces apiculatus DSM 436 TaxID=1192034 RepID=A0A017SW95_9BACT|nr:CheB methylesterase domain-containing protein [Chondromyces apiculatus]EYF01022.1 Chemotaxis response regulator protein-glutamate methylesterase CheB [Chondromyces apiculatus DSM 436]